MKKLLGIALSFFLFAYSQVVWASAVPVGWQKINGNNRTTYMAPAVYSGSMAASGQAVWDTAVGGSAKLTFGAQIPSGVGSVAVVAKGTATAASVLALARGMLGGPLGVATLALPPLLEWVTTPKSRPAQNPTIAQPFEELVQIPLPPEAIFAPSQLAACAASAGAVFYGGKWTRQEGVPCVVRETPGYCENPGVCYALEKPYDPLHETTWAYRATLEAISEQWLPASMDDIAPYMTPRPIPSGLIPSLLNLDPTAKLPITNDSVTGPATGPTKPPATISESVPSSPPVTSTNTTPGNSHGLAPNTPTVTNSSSGSSPVFVGGKTVNQPTTTTTTSTYNPTTNNTTNVTNTTSAPLTVTNTTTSTTNNTYNNNSVTTRTTNITTTTVINRITNEVIEQSEKTDNDPPKKDPAEEEDYSFADPSFGKIPKLYEREYPHGLVGVWNEKIAAIKAAPLFTLVGQLMPSLPASGQCPAFTIPVNFGPWGEYGNLDVSPPCFVWDFGKVIIIISALLLSRRLIFGG